MCYRVASLPFHIAPYSPPRCSDSCDEEGRPERIKASPERIQCPCAGGVDLQSVAELSSRQHFG